MYKNERDLQWLPVLQEPLTIEPSPFAQYAIKLGVSEEDVLSSLQRLKADGIIRRIAGVVKHDKIGYACNAMFAFKVEEKRCDAVGELLSAFPFITHCYRRPTYPEWPYAIFAMVHGRDEEDLAQKAAEIKKAVSYTEMILLRSEREFKKSTFRIKRTPIAPRQHRRDNRL